MNDGNVFIVGGARTPMTDYVGALKDVSALELGAIAARGAFEQTGVDPTGRSRGGRQRAADQRRRDLRRAACRAESGRAGRRSRAHRQPPVRLGIQAAVCGAQMIQLGEAARRPDGRDREHEPGAARHPRPAHRAEARAGQARGLSLGSAPRPVLRLHDGDDRRKLRSEVRHHARGAGLLRAAQPAAGRQGVEARAASPRRSCRWRSRRARASRSSIATTTCARTRRSRCSRSCRRRSRRTAPSRPVTRAASSTAAPR